MSKFTIKDINPMTWEEMSDTVDVLLSKINLYFSEKGETISIISPLLRTGGIVGGILAIKLHVINMLPVQFKYHYKPTDIKQMISLPEILSDVSEPINILLCEGNTGTGATATKAAKIIRERYPLSKIYLATLTKVFGCSDQLEGIDGIFYGRMTNEAFKANKEEMKDFNLRPGITIFPWEKAEEEVADINETS